MQSFSVQDRSDFADTDIGALMFMEDALLLHISECSHCLKAAVVHRRKLRDHGCPVFLRLTAQLGTCEEIATIATDHVHLSNAVIEEYHFNRLSASERANAEQHLGTCPRCQDAVSAQKEFIACMKIALGGLQPESDADGSRKTRPVFGREAVTAARQRLPVLQSAAVEVLRLLDQEHLNVKDLERAATKDPVLCAHLLRVANSALLSFRHESRSVAEAISRIGFQKTRLHVWGLAAKRMFASPALRPLWNHSVEVAGLARRIAEETRCVPAEEASLAGLVHDIGRLVLFALDPTVENTCTRRAHHGASALDVEKELCGLTHAELGADLLTSWRFPEDMAQAVRSHHSPGAASSPFSALLYIAEQALETSGSVCDMSAHRECMRRLGIAHSYGNVAQLNLAPDLQMLRFAAAA